MAQGSAWMPQVVIEKLKSPLFQAVFAGLVLWCVFSIQLLHQFSFFTDRFMFIWDGQSYLETCSFATEFLRSFFSGGFDAAWSIASSSDFVKHILHDGPVQTFAMAFVFLLMGHLPTALDWQVFAVVQAICLSVSSMLLFLLSLEVTGSVGWALLAGLLFGLSPAVIVAPGRFGTEPWVVLCLISFVYLITRTSKIFKLFGGVFGGFAILLKAVLVPSVAIATVVAASYKDEASWKKLLIISAGVFIAIVPWFLFTQQTTGHGVFLTPRMAAYNAAVRLDVDSDAWCTIPTTDAVNTMQDVALDNVGLLLASTANLPEQISISVRKVGRLISHPWNDFRQPVFILINAAQQDVLHKIVLFFSLLGFTFCLTKSKLNPIDMLPSANNAISCRYFHGMHGKTILACSTVIVAGHLFYLLFQAIGRYFFTAWPFVILFAVLGVRSLACFCFDVKRPCVESNSAPGDGKHNKILLPLCVVCVALITTIVVCHLENLGLPWGGFVANQVVQPGKTFDIPFDISNLKGKSQNGCVLALIDAESACESAQVFVNGKAVDFRFHPISRYSSDWYAQSKQLQVHAMLLGIPQSQLRQWRAVSIPISLVSLTSRNLLALRNDSDKPLTIYGACKNFSYIPSPGLYASDYMLNDKTSLDLRLPQKIAVDGAQSLGDSPLVGATFVLGDSSPLRHSSLELSSSHAIQANQKYTAELEITAFPQTGISLNQVLRVNPVNAPTPDALVGGLRVAAPSSTSHLKVSLRGKIRLEGGGNRVGVKFMLQQRNGEYFMPFACPDYIVAAKGDEWQDFFIEDCIPNSYLEGGIRAVSVTLTPMPISQAKYGAGADAADALVKELYVTVMPFDSVDLARR